MIVRCDDAMVWVEADDGRQLGVPPARFPRLAGATAEQRVHWELLGPGIGIHRPDVDEDISVARLFGAPLHAGATDLRVTADGGGSNSSRSRLWKVELQRLANATGTRSTQRLPFALRAGSLP